MSLSSSCRYTSWLARNATQSLPEAMAVMMRGVAARASVVSTSLVFGLALAFAPLKVKSQLKS